MRIDPTAITKFTVCFKPLRYVRVTPMSHASTPLGMGFGDTRFASPAGSFRLLYIAKDIATGIAETIVRDRFEGMAVGELMMSEIISWGATEISILHRLRLLDLRGPGCVALRISTDIKGAKGQDEARRFSQRVYEETDLDGILYRSRLTGKECAAIYDCAVATKLGATDVIPLHRLADLVPALESLHVELVR
jgi:hypothetical protein